jgi:hypothetical protein
MGAVELELQKHGGCILSNNVVNFQQKTYLAKVCEVVHAVTSTVTLQLNAQVRQTVEDCLKANPCLQPPRMLHFYCHTCSVVRTWHVPSRSVVCTVSCFGLQHSVVP